MDAATPAPFRATNSERLGAAGLLGATVSVAFRDDALHLLGEAGGGVKLSASMVDRLRIGFQEGRSRTIYQAMIWPKEERAPIMLYPVRETADLLGYTEAMRDYAAAVAKANGLGRVERGVSSGNAVVNLAFSVVPGLVLAGVAVTKAQSGQWLGWAGGAVILLAIGGFFTWLYLARQRPRPVRDLAELEQQLPKVVGR